MPSKPAVLRSLAGTPNTVPPVGSNGTRIILVTIVTARSVRPLRRSSRSRTAKPSCCLCPYFHLVFTVPHDLNPLILAHKRPLLTLLFNAASQTLVQFGHHNLGGQIGCTMVLHTWDQTLGAHFHVHCIIAAGALSANGERWIDADPRFLFPVQALSTVFRGKFYEALGQARFGRRRAPC